MLRIENLHVHYGAAEALRGVDLEIPEGVTVALVGANGAGKTTLLKAVMGLVRPSQGRLLLDGKDVTGTTPVHMVRNGLALSPEGREMFGDLSVRENLRLGALPLGLSESMVESRIEEVASDFRNLRNASSSARRPCQGGSSRWWRWVVP